ncbi:MAG TPA: cupin domain-containing protein [Vicinamibacteria bacterium]|nr:cupin domain-containing protein [Vicinamibacteria bacterium]
MKRLVSSAALVLLALCPVFAQDAKTARPVLTSPSGTELRVLVDAKSLGGGEVEVVELTFKPNSDSGAHHHAVTETFYVLEGEMEQVINGKPVRLGPGMVASIRSTDQVRHRSGPNGAKVLVIWAPGGEIERVASRWKAQ